MTERESFDPTSDNAAEDLDEDRLGVDPLEKGVEPPERWSEVDQFGTTPNEAREGADLDHRLREEQPDIDESIVDDEEPATSALEAENPIKETSDYKENADRVGGSVAHTIREPENVDEL